VPTCVPPSFRQVTPESVECHRLLASASHRSPSAQEFTARSVLLKLKGAKVCALAVKVWPPSVE